MNLRIWLLWRDVWLLISNVSKDLVDLGNDIATKVCGDDDKDEGWQWKQHSFVSWYSDVQWLMMWGWMMVIEGSGPHIHIMASSNLEPTQIKENPNKAIQHSNKTRVVMCAIKLFGAWISLCALNSSYLFSVDLISKCRYVIMPISEQFEHISEPTPLPHTIFRSDFVLGIQGTMSCIFAKTLSLLHFIVNISSHICRISPEKFRSGLRGSINAERYFDWIQVSTSKC